MPAESKSPRNEYQTSEYELLPRSTSAPPPRPPHEPKSMSRRWAALLLNTWLWEISAIVFSLACFVAIICVLAVFNGKPQPQFAYGFTLNAIISILATASKSSLIYVIGECIGQLKWIWFYQGEKKQLHNMQIFDNASRGPLGSLFMMLQHKGRSLASLGAILTILALTFDPFVQQILSYPTRQALRHADSSSAIAPQAFYFFPETYSIDFQGVVNTGIWSESPDQLEPGVTCASGNCHWEAIDSVGVCSQCEDITAQTELQCDALVINDTTTRESNTTECRIIPPQGDTVNITTNATVSRIMSMDDGGYHPQLLLDVPDQIVWSPFQREAIENQNGSNATYAGVKSPQSVIAHAELALASNETTGLSPLSDLATTFRLSKVSQCALELCARTYQISVSNGTTTFNISDPDFGQLFSIPDMIFTGPDCWMPTPVPGADPKSVNLTDLPSVSGYADISKFAFCPVPTYDLRGFLAGRTIMPYVAPRLSQWHVLGSRMQPGNPAAGKIASDGLEGVMGNVAASLTRAAFTASNYTVKGNEYAFEVYISVDWVWLLLPAALVAFGILFLGLTMYTNKRQRLHPWKSSILAVLFHGFDNTDREVTSNQTATAEQMETTAQGMHVKLRRVSEQWGLMLDSS
ncbi:hypothetical protein BJY00DRAFT_320801 [Aspergillus carlsbadensis]|nr:hypothetical protein BJY00DRAFT_320801 [Aspergillus carlsbadensis]